MKAGDVLVRIAQLKLLKNVVTHAPGGAGGEGGNGQVGKMHSQRAQLPVFRAKFVAPLGDAVRFIDGEESDRHPLQPVDGIGPRQPLGRKIEQPICALGGLAHDLASASRRSSELFSTAAGIPICASCATWSCMSAISGEMTITVFPSMTAGNW